MQEGARKRGGRGPGVPLPGLRDARIGRGLTVRALAEAAKIDPSTVSLLENGNRGAQRSTIKKLSDTLDVSAEVLAGASREASGVPGGEVMALRSLWAEERGVSEEEAERQIRAKQEELARGARGRRRLGPPRSARIVLRSGGENAAADAVSAVRGT